MKLKIQLLIASAAIFSFVSCGQKSNESENAAKTENAAGAKEEAHGEEEAATIAVLTQDQMKSVGVQLGTIENKNLTATIKVNGALRVPNNNKANATSLYGGLSKPLKCSLATRSARDR